MQQEIAAEFPGLNITLLGCNAAGEELENSTATNGVDLAWLQDNDADMDNISDAWAQWDVGQRDFIIADANNRELIRLNLTPFSLFLPENYELVKSMLVDAINYSQRGDINRDGNVNLLDVAPMIEILNATQYQLEADANVDGRVDIDDISSFVDLLLGN